MIGEPRSQRIVICNAPIVEGAVMAATEASGGAETNSEMAIEMIGEPRSQRIIICNAPIVEGAVMAATEASGGASLREVVATAHELAPA